MISMSPGRNRSLPAGASRRMPLRMMASTVTSFSHIASSSRTRVPTNGESSGKPVSNE